MFSTFSLQSGLAATWRRILLCTCAVGAGFAMSAASADNAANTRLNVASPEMMRPFTSPFTPRNRPRSPATPGDRPEAQITIADFSVVEIRGTAMPNARSRGILGTNRQGGGIVIDEHLILTVGYLVTETEKIEIVSVDGKTMPASLVGYDNTTGIGLVRAAVPLSVKPIAFADSAKAAIRDPVLVVGFDGVAPAYIVSRREFAGTWEYLLDDALFTAPATTGWSGAALINQDGKLLGVGFLLVADALGGSRPVPGNMFVPIDTLKPILDDLVTHGKTAEPPRPWLGVHLQDMKGRLLVTRVTDGGPAATSGIVEGDIILGVDGKPVKNPADFYRTLWESGDAGVEVALEVLKENTVKTVAIKTAERAQFLRRPSMY